MSTSGDVAYVDLPPEQARALAASELRGGLVWVVFGIAVLALSWRMDRLEADGLAGLEPSFHQMLREDLVRDVVRHGPLPR